MGNKIALIAAFSLVLTACGKAASYSVSGGGSSFLGLSDDPVEPTSVSVSTNNSKMCANRSTAQNEVYGLPKTANLPANTSFLSNWSAQVNGGGFYGVQSMDTCRMQPDGFKTQHDKLAVRVEVNPGDDVLGSGGERSEIIGMQNQSSQMISEVKASGTVFYAMSYYFPKNWDGTQLSGNGDSWSYVMQFHPNSTGALIALGAARKGPGQPQKYWFQGSKNYDLTDGGLISLGKWTDFIFSFNWSTGAVKIYRRDEGVNKFSLVLDVTDAAMLPANDGGYFKQGLYRGPDTGGRTDILWMGPAARATSFQAAENAAFGTNSGF